MLNGRWFSIRFLNISIGQYFQKRSFNGCRQKWTRWIGNKLLSEHNIPSMGPVIHKVKFNKIKKLWCNLTLNGNFHSSWLTVPEILIHFVIGKLFIPSLRPFNKNKISFLSLSVSQSDQTGFRFNLNASGHSEIFLKLG